MADVTIADLNVLSSGDVDRATDVLEIQTANENNKITPNALMGIAGSAVGTTDTQTLTNKTITAPTISSPVLSGALTGTYTLGGTPTFPSSVVTLTGAQTLTGKTLTSPTINTATIVNPTLTVDAVNEFTSAAGVTIDGVLLKDSNMNGSFLTDASVTNAKLATGAGEPGGAWETWTPTYGASGSMTYTSVTTDLAKYKRVGNTVFFQLRATGTTGGTASNRITFTLPVESISTNCVFSSLVADGAAESGIAFLSSSTTTVTMARSNDGNYTLGVGKQIRASGSYEVA